MCGLVLGAHVTTLFQQLVPVGAKDTAQVLAAIGRLWGATMNMEGSTTISL